jgi:hypothetical protein
MPKVSTHSLFQAWLQRPCVHEVANRPDENTCPLGKSRHQLWLTLFKSQPYRDLFDQGCYLLSMSFEIAKHPIEHRVFHV